ncbi:MAG TPA: hypothetical protein VGX76_16825, partial [Pirellulales bacterium]|nr:hypothetical protein [Pirellulales bacterium]
MRNQLREQMVLEAGRRRLNPRQLRCRRQKRRSDLPEESIGVGDFARGFIFVSAVDDLEGRAGLANASQPRVIDRGKDDKLHGD